jgi:hypothetical protein
VGKVPILTRPRTDLTHHGSGPGSSTFKFLPTPSRMSSGPPPSYQSRPSPVHQFHLLISTCSPFDSTGNIEEPQPIFPPSSRPPDNLNLSSAHHLKPRRKTHNTRPHHACLLRIIIPNDACILGLIYPSPSLFSIFSPKRAPVCILFRLRASLSRCTV